MSIDITMGLESQKNDNAMVTDLDEIVFNLVCKGESDLAKKYVRNYLKNFYKVGL